MGVGLLVSTEQASDAYLLCPRNVWGAKTSEKPVSDDSSGSTSESETAAPR
jgi:hypothetical protein